MRRVLVVLLLTCLMVLGLGASSALAVPLHQHGFTTPGGTTAVTAQGFCRNPDVFAEGTNAHGALHNYHFNVHLGNSPVDLLHFC